MTANRFVPTRRGLTFGLAATALAACTTADQEAILGAVLGGTEGSPGLTSAEAAAGIREALIQGVGNAIATVGVPGGYLQNGRIHIPLPGFLADMQGDLARFGLSGPLDELEVQLNRGAERAAPRARDIFVSTIRSMSVSDAIGIVRGGSTAATDYFRARTEDQLTRLFTPVLERALQEAGAIATYDRLAARLAAIPLAPKLAADAKQDLIDHGVEGGLDGLFAYIAEEEAAIRANPAKRTSDILRRVFG